MTVCGLLEYGCSLNRPWLTDKGMAALMGYERGRAA